MAHLPRLVGDRLGDVGDLLAVRALMHRDVADEDRPAARHDHRGGKEGLALAWRDDLRDMVEARLEGAGDAGDHGVGMALQHHAGTEDVAIEIDHALAVAAKRAAALQFLVEEVDVVLVVVRHLGVRDRDVLGALQTQLFDGLADPVLAADENRVAIAGIAEGKRRPDHLFLLALGEDDTFPVGADPVEDHLQGRGGRVDPRRKLAAVFPEILDRFAGHAAVHRRLCDG